MTFFHGMVMLYHARVLVEWPEMDWIKHFGRGVVGGASRGLLSYYLGENSHSG